MGYTERRLEPILNIDRLYTAFVASYDGSFHFLGESHEMWELDCVLEGRVGITSGTQVYECERGELVIHPADTFHSAWVRNGEHGRLLTVSFQGDRIGQLVPYGKMILNAYEWQTVRQMCEELGGKFPKDSLSMLDSGEKSIQIFKNLLELLCLSLSRRREIEAPAEDTKATRFSEIAAYLQRNTEKALTVEKICNDCAIGRTVLKELFRSYTGMGVIKYYNHLRVRCALHLMEQGLSMAEIASRMHFSSQSYRSAFFRRETGLSPMAYLKSNQA